MEEISNLVELNEDHKFEFDGVRYIIPKGEELKVLKILTNKSDESKKLYKCLWEDKEFLISTHKCTYIYGKETDPKKLKELDNWFDNVSEKVIDEKDKEYDDIIITMKKRGSFYSDFKKTVRVKIDGKDKIKLDDIFEIREKLEELFIEKEDKHDFSDSYNQTWISGVGSNNLTFVFGDDYHDTCPTSDILRYWRLVLKYFGLKEEKPKHVKMKTVKRYGVCRLPDYFDMFYIETNARKDTIDEFYSGDINKLIEKLKKEGFKANPVNIDYIFDDGKIIETNKLEV